MYLTYFYGHRNSNSRRSLLVPVFGNNCLIQVFANLYNLFTILGANINLLLILTIQEVDPSF